MVWESQMFAENRSKPQHFAEPASPICCLSLWRSPKVEHYRAIGATISCPARYSAAPPKMQYLSLTEPWKLHRALFWVGEPGYSSDSLDGSKRHAVTQKDLPNRTLLEMGGKDPHPQGFSLSRKRPVLLRANFVLAEDR